jgi:hypothetical protein
MHVIACKAAFGDGTDGSAQVHQRHPSPLLSTQPLPVVIHPPEHVQLVPEGQDDPIQRSLRRYGARSAFHPAHAAIARRLRQVWATDRQTFDRVWSELDDEERSVLVTCVLEGLPTHRVAALQGTNQPRLMSLLIQSLDLVGHP